MLEALRAKATLSKTVAFLTKLKCWKIMPIFNLKADKSFPVKLVISLPSTKTLPEVGFCNKLTVLTRVDLPAPDEPTIPKNSPFFISRLALSTAIKSLPSRIKLTVVSSNLIIFIIYTYR